MGQAKRRKDSGHMPEKTEKPRPSARRKVDGDEIMGMLGMGFPVTAALLAGAGSLRKKVVASGGGVTLYEDNTYDGYIPAIDLFRSGAYNTRGERG